MARFGGADSALASGEQDALQPHDLRALVADLIHHGINVQP